MFRDTLNLLSKDQIKLFAEENSISLKGTSNFNKEKLLDRVCKNIDLKTSEIEDRMKTNTLIIDDINSEINHLQSEIDNLNIKKNNLSDDILECTDTLNYLKDNIEKIANHIKKNGKNTVKRTAEKKHITIDDVIHSKREKHLKKRLAILIISILLNFIILMVHTFLEIL